MERRLIFFNHNLEKPAYPIIRSSVLGATRGRSLRSNKYHAPTTPKPIRTKLKRRVKYERSSFKLSLESLASNVIFRVQIMLLNDSPFFEDFQDFFPTCWLGKEGRSTK